MEPKHTMEPSGSPVPGVIPEPLRVHYDTSPAEAGRPPAPQTSATAEPASSPRRRNPAGVLLAKLLSAVRGDTYPQVPDRPPPTARDGAEATGSPTKER